MFHSPRNPFPDKTVENHFEKMSAPVARMLLGALITLPVIFPATVHAQNIQLPDSLYTAGDTVAWVKRVPAYCEGPAWQADSGYVYFTQQGANSAPNWPIWRVKPGVDTGIVWVNTYQNNGIEFDAQGRLVSAQNGRLSRYFPNGTLDTTLIASSSFGQANDLSIGPNGAIYFTDLQSRVFYLSPTRQLSTATTNVTSANGIEWIKEENAVYVNSGSNLYKFNADTVTGALSGRTTFISAGLNSADGGTLDIHGNRYVGNYGSGQLRIYNARGDSIGRITFPNPPGTYNNRAGAAGNVDNCVFGGTDRKTLYLTGDGGLYSIKLKIPGRPYAQGAAPVSIRAAAIKKLHDKDAMSYESRDLRGRTLPEAWKGPMLKAVPRPADE